MTAPVPRFATAGDHLLLEGYARFCHRVALPDRALRDRLRLARLFLAEHPDRGVWMTRPAKDQAGRPAPHQGMATAVVGRAVRAGPPGPGPAGRQGPRG